jgi:peptide-methionine (S)-S-oxide reductase
VDFIDFLSNAMARLKRWIAIGLLTVSLYLGVGLAPSYAQDLAKATFAGGCFWCMEKPFDELKGVISTTSGYTGGKTANPTYKQVSSGTTGHAEAVQVEYDPQQVSYETLLDMYWRNVDPLDRSGQFCDRGNQYRTSIFYHSDEQRQLAEQSKQKLGQSGQFSSPIFTPIVAAGNFYAAEDYHQNYYQTNAVKYRFYRYTCGRDQRLTELWGNSAQKSE